MVLSSDRDSSKELATIPPLGYLLRQAAAAHRLQMERALCDLEITPSQFLVLRLLAENVGSSSADVARMTSLTAATVSVIVANLKRRGALTSRAHAVHGRVQHLDLTDLGHTLLKDCKSRVIKTEAELGVNLNEAQVETIRAWLISLLTLPSVP